MARISIDKTTSNLRVGFVSNMKLRQRTRRKRASSLIELEKTAAMVVNYKTKDLISKSVLSFRKYYPDIHLLIVDGSSYDDSTDWVYKFCQEDLNSTLIACTFNIHHGPGMNLGLHLLNYDYVYIFDSDTFLNKASLLEQMFKIVRDLPSWYGVGDVVGVQDNGMDDNENGFPYLHPRCMLIQRCMYFKFHPFFKHGAPCIKAMTQIKNQGLTKLLIDFNVDAFLNVNHGLIKTCKRYGYDLKEKK